MADEQAPAPDEQTPASDEQPAEAPTEPSPEATSEQPEAAQEPAEAQAETEQTAPEERGSADKGAPEAASDTEQGTAPDESDEPPEISGVEPEDEAQEFNEEDEAQYEDRQVDDDDGMITALDVDQESLDALVKSSSMQLRQVKSMEPDVISSGTAMVQDKMDKHAIKAKEVLGEVIDIRKGSVSGDAGDRRTARFMNTYKLDSDNPFNPQKVDKILMSVMEEAFQELEYEPEKVCKGAKWASNTIKAKVKQLEFERYKIISLVSIGEKHNQDVLCSCRFLWDVDRDNYSCYTLENTYVFGIALCFGLYYE